jgi:hypothetical protein
MNIGRLINGIMKNLLNINSIWLQPNCNKFNVLDQECQLRQLISDAAPRFNTLAQVLAE